MKKAITLLSVFLFLIMIITGASSCQKKDNELITPSSNTPATPAPINPTQSIPIQKISKTSISRDGCFLRLKGEIDEFTDIALANNYESLRKSECPTAPVFLFLNSNGGDLEAAIRAGEFVREKEIWTYIDKDQNCASACVFLFLGGVNRDVAMGKIGLHRPYSEELSMSKSDSMAKYEKTNRLIKQYLNRMNIPEELLNIINAVPPGEIKWMSVRQGDSKQLKELHIDGDDPVYADQSDSDMAKMLGISKQELYKRHQRATAICSPLMTSMSEADSKNYGECLQDVLFGRR